MYNDRFLRNITRHVPPPESPDSVFGTTLNRWFGPDIDLPNDYLSFLQAYGPGSFLSADVSYARFQILDLISLNDRYTVDALLRAAREYHQCDPIGNPLVYPDVPGLLPWGSFGNSKYMTRKTTCYWLVDGPSDTWPVLIDEAGEWTEYESMLRFLFETTPWHRSERPLHTINRFFGDDHEFSEFMPTSCLGGNRRLPLNTIVDAPEPQDRIEAIEQSAVLGERGAIPLLMRALDDNGCHQFVWCGEIFVVAASAIKALVELGRSDDTFVSRLQKIPENHELFRVRQEALTALIRLDAIDVADIKSKMCTTTEGKLAFIWGIANARRDPTPLFEFVDDWADSSVATSARSAFEFMGVRNWKDVWDRSSANE